MPSHGADLIGVSEALVGSEHDGVGARVVQGGHVFSGISPQQLWRSFQDVFEDIQEEGATVNMHYDL